MYVESVLKGYRLLPVPENPQLRASLEGKSLEELTRILEGYKKQAVTLQHGFDIHSRPSTKDGQFPPRNDVLVCLQKIPLIFKHIIFITGFHNINQMIRHPFSIHHIIHQILSRAQIHTTIYLPTVSTDDFSVQPTGQCRRQRSFPRSRRSYYRYQIVFHHPIRYKLHKGNDFV